MDLDPLAHERRVLRLEISNARADAVTAAIALAHPTFQEVFSSELLAQGEHVRVSRMAFLWFSVDGTTDLIRAADDARALSVLAEVDRLGREATSAHGGTLVDGPLVGTARAVFPSAEGAVLAGIALQASLDALPSLPPVRAAVHEGRCIALRHGARMEFFGETLARGAALLADAAAGSIPSPTSSPPARGEDRPSNAAPATSRGAARWQVPPLGPSSAHARGAPWPTVAPRTHV